MNPKQSIYTSFGKTLVKIAILTLMFSALPANLYAETATPSATPKTTEPTGNAQIEELKTRLATKVAELRTVVKRAMYGTVKSVSMTSAAVETKTKDIKIELTDDVVVSQIISGKRTVLSIEDLEVKDPITVFGSYDETLDLLKAQYIFIESATNTTHVAGTVADVDSEDFVLTVNTKEGRTITIDIEKTTKTTAWTPSGGIVKGGFSKIAIGDTVHIIGTPDKKSDNRISATRILDLGNITGAASAPTVTTAPSPEATSSVTPKSTTPKPTPTPTP